jgi:hypothetical protein
MKLLSLSLPAMLALLAGCATTPPAMEKPALDIWTQLGANGATSLRALVPGAAPCPAASINGIAQPMMRRANASPQADTEGNRAFAPPFEVSSCELALPSSTSSAVVDGRSIPLRKTDTRRIVVLGDTGCRIKVPADGKADPIQNCANADAWPWQKIAASAARTQPDLVIHVGDYHYREYCDDPERCTPLVEKGLVVSYGWAGWDADFFTPAKPLLAAAPWVFVRGNHENCDRAGEGWMRFLSPLPYQACSDQRYKSASRSVLGNNFTADAYRIDLDSQLGLIIADNSGHEDYRPASATPQDIALFKRTLAILNATPTTQQQWFFSHRPLWYDLLSATAQPNALQSVLHEALPANVQVAFAGHQHTFEAINFSPDADRKLYPTGRPAQVIVGGGGTQLESLDPQSPFYEGETGIGSKDRVGHGAHQYEGVASSSGILLNRYSFLLLERDADGWGGTVLDVNGQPISRCRLAGGKKELVCGFPGR